MLWLGRQLHRRCWYPDLHERLLARKHRRRQHHLHSPPWDIRARTMIQMFKRLLRCTRATAAVEAAIFAPIYLVLTLGVTDIGMGVFVRMSVNAATQAGALYAVVNYNTGKACERTTARPATWVNSGACVAAINA